MASTTSRRARPAIDPTPIFAVVGATDLAVERVRTAVANVTQTQAEAQKQAQKAIREFDPRAAAQEVPTRAVAVALETASKAEARYEEFAKRGKQLVDRIRTQQSTQEFLNQAGSTVSRTKGAVTTTRRSVEGTANALRGTLGVARRETGGVIRTSTENVEQAVDTTEQSARKTTARARRGTAAAKAAAKGARTSAAKTASSAGDAAKDAADKIGD